MIWSANEIDVFLEAIKDERLYPLFFFYLSTGTRRGEALALRWDKLHFDTCQIDIHYTLTFRQGKPYFGLPKTKAGYRTIPASKELFTVLAKHREAQMLEKQIEGYHDHNLVFPAKDGKPLRSLGESWERLKSKAIHLAISADPPLALQNIRIHDLRHTFASMCVAAGVDAARLAKIIGHSDPNFTYETYVHVFENQHRFSVPNLSTLKGSPTSTDEGKDDDDVA